MSVRNAASIASNIVGFNSLIFAFSIGMMIIIDIVSQSIIHGSRIISSSPCLKRICICPLNSSRFGGSDWMNGVVIRCVRVIVCSVFRL